MTAEFQKALLRGLYQRPEFIPIIHQLNPKVFDLVQDQLLLEMLHEYVSNFKSLPSKPEIAEFFTSVIRTKNIPSDVSKLMVQSIHSVYEPMDGEFDYVKAVVYGELMKKRSTLALKEFTSRLKDTPTDQVKGLVDWLSGEFAEIRKIGGDNAGEATIRSAGYIDQAHIRPDIIGHPTVFPGMNALTSAGGFHAPQINIILSSPKAFKTGFMISLAIGYMRNGLKVAWIDTENGPDSIRNRIEQHLLHCNMEQLKDPEIYGKLEEVITWNTKLKGTILVDGYTPYRSCVGDIRTRLDQVKLDSGFVPDILIIDSIDHLVPSRVEDRKKDERHQLKCVYFEVIAMNMDYGCFTFCPSQTNRASLDKKVFSAKDIAEDFSKIANCHSAWALCRTPEETEANLCRLVPVVQRQGKKYSPSTVVVLNMEEEFGIVEEISIDEAANRLPDTD